MMISTLEWIKLSNGLRTFKNMCIYKTTWKDTTAIFDGWVFLVLWKIPNSFVSWSTLQGIHVHRDLCGFMICFIILWYPATQWLWEFRAFSIGGRTYLPKYHVCHLQSVVLNYNPFGMEISGPFPLWLDISMNHLTQTSEPWLDRFPCAHPKVNRISVMPRSHRMNDT